MGDGLALDPRRIQHGNLVSLSLTATSRSISGGISICISEGWMHEKKHWRKWLIWYLWEHFVVPEHRIPIWVILRLRFSVEDIVEDMENVDIPLDV